MKLIKNFHESKYTNQNHHYVTCLFKPIFYHYLQNIIRHWILRTKNHRFGKKCLFWPCFSSLYIMRIAHTIEGSVIHFCFLKQSRGKRVPNIWRTWFMLELVLRFAYSSKTYKCKSKNSRLMFVNTWVELFKTMWLHKYRICKS